MTRAWQLIFPDQALTVEFGEKLNSHSQCLKNQTSDGTSLNNPRTSTDCDERVFSQGGLYLERILEHKLNPDLK